jgi:hypothetical protein
MIRGTSRRQDISEEAKLYPRGLLLLSWYTILIRYRSQSLTFESDKFPAISGMAREIGACKITLTKQGFGKKMHIVDCCGLL